MDWNTAQQLLRIGMNALGAFLVAKGLSGDVVTAVTGVLMSGASIAWWWFWNKGVGPVPAVVTEETEVQ